MSLQLNKYCHHTPPQVTTPFVLPAPAASKFNAAVKLATPDKSVAVAIKRPEVTPVSVPLSFNVKVVESTPANTRSEIVSIAVNEDSEPLAMITVFVLPPSAIPVGGLLARIRLTGYGLSVSKAASNKRSVSR